MKKLKSISIIFILILISFDLISQSINKVTIDSRMKRIISTLDKFTEQYQQQKVYLHFDKPSYIAGEDIWFKAYIVDGINHIADTLIKNIYLELINSEKQVVQIKVLKIENGSTFGDFNLLDTIPEGNYQLRAYTNWMRNFDESFLLTKKNKIFYPDIKDFIRSRFIKAKKIVRKTPKK